MLFLKLILISLISGSSNKQESSIVNKIKQELITDIYKEMIATFNNIYETKTVSICSKTETNSMEMSKLTIRKVTGFKMSNDAVGIVKCKLQNASAAELKNDITSALTAAIEKKIDAVTDVLSKLNQDATSQLGGVANTQSASTTNDIKNFVTTTINTINTTITNIAIMEARSKTINDFDLGEGVFAIQSDEEITNLAKGFLESEAISQVVNKVISTIVDEVVTTVVNKVIDSITVANKVIDSTAVTNIVEAKTETVATQKVKSEGIIDCIGGVNSNIFWFALVIIILVLTGIGYTYKMSCSQR